MMELPQYAAPEQVVSILEVFAQLSPASSVLSWRFEFNVQERFVIEWNSDHFNQRSGS